MRTRNQNWTKGIINRIDIGLFLTNEFSIMGKLAVLTSGHAYHPTIYLATLKQPEAI